MAEEERNGYLLLEIACALDARDPWRADTRHGKARGQEGMGRHGMTWGHMTWA